MDHLFIMPLTPKISLVILLTACHAVLVTIVWRINFIFGFILGGVFEGV